MQEDDFEEVEKIGRGTFGEVFKARAKDTGLLCVIKRVDLTDLPLEEKECAENEVSILAQLCHPYIIRHFGSFTTAGLQLNIVMEYADRQSLYHRIHAQKEPFEEDYIWKMFMQTALALLYIHQRNILHRDIKSANVFLATDPLDGGDVVKLGDFGVAKHVLSRRSLLRTIIGTPYYLSPEICQNRPYGERSDVWALGVVLYELCTLRHPFEAANQGSLVLKIIRGRYAPVGAPYSPRLAHVCSLCLAADTAKRPTVLELLALPAVVHKAEELCLPLPPEVLAAHRRRLRLHAAARRSAASPPPRPAASPTAASAAPGPDALRSRSGGAVAGDDPRAVVYITATDATQSKAGLPRFNREAIELRKPGGHIQNRRVRAKKQALSSTAPVSPVFSPEASRQPSSKQQSRRVSAFYPTATGTPNSQRSQPCKGKPQAVRTSRSPPAGGGAPARPLPGGYRAPAAGQRCGKLGEDVVAEQSKGAARPMWDKAARFTLLNLNDTSAQPRPEEEEEEDCASNGGAAGEGAWAESPSAGHEGSPADPRANHQGEAESDDAASPQSGRPLRTQWQRPEATLQFPEVLATLQGTLRVPEEAGLDGTLSPGQQTPSELNGSIQEEASLRAQPVPADSDVERECSTGEVEEELAEPPAGEDLEEIDTAGWAYEEDDAMPLVAAAVSHTVQQRPELRASAEQIRKEGEALVGPEAFRDVYRKVSSSEMAAEALQAWVEGRLCALGVSEQVMAAVVQHVYQLMALEAALEGCNDQSTWTDESGSSWVADHPPQLQQV